MHVTPVKAGMSWLIVLSLVGCEGLSSGGAGRVEWTGEAYLPEGAVLPTPETIESGEYFPLSRPLFVYVRHDSLKRPEVAAFLRYYLSDEGQQLVTESGYVRLNEAQIAESRQVLEEAISVAGGPQDSPTGLSGEVKIDGSSTVYPISQAIAEEFPREHPKVRVSLSTSGTGGGFEKFLVDEVTDINDASRPIKESEMSTAKAKGIEYTELKIAIDGLTVVVNPQNNWVDGLTVSDLRKIWEPGSTVQKWSDIRPEWPDVEIELFGPDTDSGTFDYFTEAVCGKEGESRSDYEPNVDDNTLVRGVAGSASALGYFGYAYYAENRDRVKAVAISPASE